MPNELCNSHQFMSNSNTLLKFKTFNLLTVFCFCFKLSIIRNKSIHIYRRFFQAKPKQIFSHKIRKKNGIKSKHMFVCCLPT